MDAETLAERIRRAMTLRGVGQNELEAAAGISRGHLSRILSGQRKRLSPDMIAKLVRELRVNHAWLLEGRGPIEGEAPDVHPRVAALAGRVARATPEALVAASSMLFAGGASLDTLPDEALVSLIADMARAARVAVLEAESAKATAGEQEADEEAERAAFRAGKPAKLPPKPGK